MRDDEHRAGEFQQRFLERAQRLDVEVVRRLVEQQHVRARDQHLRQVEPPSLTTGELAHRLLLVGAAEVEAREVGARGHLEFADRDHVLAARDILEDGLFGLQRVARLVDVRDLHRLADHDLSGIGLFFLRDQFEQGALAGAVRADDADDRPGGHLERKLVDEQAIAVALRNLFHREYLVAQALRDRDEDLLRLVPRLAFLGRELLEPGEARLGLRLAPLRVLPHPLELVLHRLDARRLLARLDLQALLLLLEPARVVAFPRNAVAAVELEDPARGVIEEVAVVRDGDHGAREALQVLLEPLDALGIEVVGRLVEQQQIRFRQQQPAQGDTALLAAGQHVHFLLPGRKAQRVGRHLELVGAAGVDDRLELRLLLGELVEVRVGLGIRGVDLIQPFLRRRCAAERGFHGLADSLVFFQDGFLFQVAHADAGHPDHVALVVVVGAGHDFQQRRLARAVQPEHADLRAGKEVERDVLQDDALRGNGLAHPAHGVDVLSHPL